MIIKIKRLNKQSKLPVKVHSSDACYDVVATSVKDLGDGRVEYGLGISLQPEEMGTGVQFDLRPRSSIHKTGLLLSNCIGTGDEGYTGEYKAVFYNIIKSLPNYKIGDRILQMQCTKAVAIELIEDDSFSETDRGTGGFGSSGNK